MKPSKEINMEGKSAIEDFVSMIEKMPEQKKSVLLGFALGMNTELTRVIAPTKCAMLNEGANHAK